MTRPIQGPCPRARVAGSTSALTAIVAGILLLGCSPDRIDTLRVGLNPWPGYEFLYLAQEKGFFRDEGVDVRIVEFMSLSDARRAYERGQIDALGTTVIEVLQVREHTPRSPQIVQVADYSDGADVILARRGVRGVAGLRGARVGVELASLGVYMLARALEQAGLTLADVEQVSMDQTSMQDALVEGKLDAIVTYPPTSVKLLRDGKASAIFSSADIPGEVVDVIAVEREVNEHRPQETAALLRAYRRAVTYAALHPEESYGIMAEREGITPAEFREALTTGIHLVSEAEQAIYLQPGGKISAVIDNSDRVLRQSGQISGPDRRSDALTAAFVGGARSSP